MGAARRLPGPVGLGAVDGLAERALRSGRRIGLVVGCRAGGEHRLGRHGAGTVQRDGCVHGGALALQAAGMAWIALIAEPGLAYGELIAPLVVAGIGASMAIPPAASSVVGAVAQEEVGKAAGANSMLRELGGVFGIAILVAVFAGAGSYASAEAFSDGFAAAIAVSAALSLVGAIAGLGLPGRPQAAGRSQPVPALATEGGT